eukprot:Lithocolla_globosa_v1_NODE_1828_length_2283_cov_49.946809.p1 type:complete len:369 gc:universal NODE_1828_length_2283_cov_49.946809:1070-2176(+)
MKTILSVFFATVAAEWVVKAPLPLQRSDQICVVDDTTIIVCGGCVTEQAAYPDGATWTICPEITDTCSEYDSKTDTWSSIPSMPRARQRFAAALVDDKLYVVGGVDEFENMFAQVDVYDVSAQTWSTPSTLTIPDEYQTSDCSAFSLGTTMYVTGGFHLPEYSLPGMTHSIDTTDNSWSFDVAQHNHLRGDMCAVVLDGEGWTSGGWGSEDFCVPVNDLESFNAEDNTWTEKHTGHGEGDDDPYDDGDKSCSVYGDVLYAFGGEQKDDDCAYSVVIDHVESYDVSTDRWTYQEDMTLSVPRFRFCAVTIDSTLYVIGGQGSYETKANETFHPIFASVEAWDLEDGASVSSTLAVPFVLMFLSLFQHFA